MNNKKKMKFLSESILLEESGLPMINTIITISITAFIVLFLLWANMLVMEESVMIEGQVLKYENMIEGEVLKYENMIEFIGFVKTKDIISISKDAEVFIDIPGITSRKSLRGNLAYINTSPQYDSQNNVYYKVQVKLVENNEKIDELSSILVSGMESQLKVVTGSRTMLEYLLGTLYDTGKNAFDIK